MIRPVVRPSSRYLLQIDRDPRGVERHSVLVYSEAEARSLFPEALLEQLAAGARCCHCWSPLAEPVILVDLVVAGAGVASALFGPGDVSPPPAWSHQARAAYRASADALRGY